MFTSVDVLVGVVAPAAPAPFGAAVCTNLQRVPYGQVPVLANVRQTSVLYLGWRCTGRRSSRPWANWHLLP